MIENIVFELQMRLPQGQSEQVLPGWVIGQMSCHPDRYTVSIDPRFATQQMLEVGQDSDFGYDEMYYPGNHSASTRVVLSASAAFAPDELIPVVVSCPRTIVLHMRRPEYLAQRDYHVSDDALNVLFRFWQGEAHESIVSYHEGDFVDLVRDGQPTEAGQEIIDRVFEC